VEAWGRIRPRDGHIQLNEHGHAARRAPSVTVDVEPIVFVVDDDPSVLEGVRSLLTSVGLRVQTFATARMFLDHPRPDHPGCVVLDVRMPGLGGLDLQRELAKTGASIPIVFVTGHGDVRMTVQAMKAGAVEFLMKPFREGELLDAVHEAIGRDRTERRLRTELGEIRRLFASLTPRERQVMALVTDGLLNKQIAAELGTSEITVKVHRSQVMKKMHAESLADLVRTAERLGLDRPKHTGR
jgi:FixJ family two-component response regulator